MIMVPALRPAMSPAMSNRASQTAINFDSPVSMLFAASEPGTWYDPSDMSTLFQDSAGTTPVTAVEQPVGRMLDKSGRGNHATQATTTKRPVLKIDAGGCYYLSFDGVDDALQTGNINFTSTDKMTVWAGFVKTINTGQQLLVELSNNWSINSAFVLGATSGPSNPNSGFGSRGSAYLPYVQITTSLGVPLVASAVGGISEDTCSLKINGVTATSVTDQGTGTYGNYPLYIGARAGTSYFFNGRLYGLIVRGAQSTLSQIDEVTELYMKKKVGIA